MQYEDRTPIALVTGFLGAGKTTLLQRILEKTDRRLAVLMNEFGELAVDSRILEGENVQMIELAGGCVCCELAGELEAAVAEIIEKARPDCIVVEATGVAEADALAYEVEDNLPQVRLDSVICIVDADAAIRHPDVGYTARTQLEAADIVLVNKIDLVLPAEIVEVEAKVRQHNTRAVIFRTMRCDLDTDLLFGLRRGPVPVSPAAHGKHGLSSFSFTTGNPLDEGRFRSLVSRLPQEIIRAKGFVRLKKEGWLFNYVAGRADLEPYPAADTRLVFIGRLNPDTREKILSALKECENDQ